MRREEGRAVFEQDDDAEGEQSLDDCQVQIFVNSGERGVQRSQRAQLRSGPVWDRRQEGSMAIWRRCLQ